MPTFLSDPAPAFYLILVILAVIAGGIWFRYRDRGSMIRAVGAVVLLLVLFLCDRLSESPREQAVRKIQEMSDAINERNGEKFQAHVSDSFEFKGVKKTPRQPGDRSSKTLVDLAAQYNARTTVWGFERDGFRMVNDNELDLVFDAKAEGPGGEPFPRHFKARFVKDPDGQWRVKTFTPYNIAQKERGAEEPIPGLP